MLQGEIGLSCCPGCGADFRPPGVLVSLYLRADGALYDQKMNPLLERVLDNGNWRAVFICVDCAKGHPVVDGERLKAFLEKARARLADA